MARGKSVQPRRKLARPTAMKKQFTASRQLPPGLFAHGRLTRWSIQIIMACALVAVLPACQALVTGAARRPDELRTTACLEQAQVAWQVMQREDPGTVLAQKALRRYNHAVKNLAESLRDYEGTNTWGREIPVAGARPWRITFDGLEGPGSTSTLALSGFAHCWLASEVKLHNFDHVVAHGGLGVPVVLAQDDSRRVAQPFHPPRGEFLPATAVLEFPAAVPGHSAEARLRFYNPLAVSGLKAGQHSQPLAENITDALRNQKQCGQLSIF